jgi:hypothetical protein
MSWLLLYPNLLLAQKMSDNFFKLSSNTFDFVAPVNFLTFFTLLVTIYAY